MEQDHIQDQIKDQTKGQLNLLEPIFCSDSHLLHVEFLPEEPPGMGGFWQLRVGRTSDLLLDFGCVVYGITIFSTFLHAEGGLLGATGHVQGSLPVQEWPSMVPASEKQPQNSE